MKKHRIAIFFLVLYYAWFAFVGWLIATGTDNEAEALRLTSLIIISLVLSAVYLVAFLVKMFASKESVKENFVFLWLVTLPIVIGAIVHISNL